MCAIQHTPPASDLAYGVEWRFYFHITISLESAIPAPVAVIYHNEPPVDRSFESVLPSSSEGVEKYITPIRLTLDAIVKGRTDEAHIPPSSPRN